MIFVVQTIPELESHGRIQIVHHMSACPNSKSEVDDALKHLLSSESDS